MVGLRAEAFRNLLPEGEKASVDDRTVDREFLVIERIPVELMVVVHVQDDVEALRKQFVHD